jgi:Protein of unknown function (DUF1569)
MALPDIFSKPVADAVIQRIHQLSASTQAKWGKMSVDQMLAHCNVSYEMIYDTIHKKPGFFRQFILKKIVKNIVVSETPYKQNNPTAPQFKITAQKDFDREKQRLIDFISKTSEHGVSYFDGKISHSFGKLSSIEWNNMLYKHLDHHLMQFGV